MEFVFLLRSGEFAFPVQVPDKRSGRISFRSAPQNINTRGTVWATHEVDVSEAQLVSDVLGKNRRTRCVSDSKPVPSLKGPKSRDVVAVYVLRKT
jgi:hypothetical protein